MASVETRHRKTLTNYRVVWRQTGLSGKQTEIFTTAHAADQFRVLVEASGERWPQGWLPGRGFAEPVAAALPTFGQWAERMINARANATERTRAEYHRDVRLHLNDTFGALPIDQITSEQVGLWLVAMAAKVSPKRVKDVHGLASSVMKEAVEEGLIRRNSFKGAAKKLPTVRTEEMVFLTRQEFDSIVAALPEHYRPFAVVKVLTGMRWGEITALTVADVQLLGRRTVTINKAWKRQPDGTMTLGEPKSRRSRRTISLPDEAVEALIPLVSGRRGTERLFTSRMGRTIHHSNFGSRVWHPAINRAQTNAGLEKRPRVHDLRHTHASWLINEGVDLVAIQRRLGHESIQTTIDRYGHLLPESDDRINAALERGRKTGPVPVPIG